MKDIVIKIGTDLGLTVKNIGDLEASISLLKEEIAGTDFGSKKFKDLSNALATAQSKMKDFEKATEGLETAQISQAFVGLGENIVGSLGAATGALSLFGVESETTAKLAEKSQQLVTVAMGLRSASEFAVNAAIVRRTVSENLAGVAIAFTATKTALLNTVTIFFTKTLTALRPAVIATGIGALAVAAGLLYANFDKVAAFTTKVIEKFGALKVIANAIGDAFNYVGEALGFVDSAEEKSLKTVQALNEANKSLLNTQQNKINLLKAQGATEEEIFEAEFQHQKTIADGLEAEYQARKKITAETEEQKKALEESRLAFENANNEINVLLEANNTRRRADAKSEIDEEKKKLEEKTKVNADYQKNIATQLEDVRIRNIKDGTERAIAAESKELERKLQAIKGNSKSEQELRIQLELETNAKIDSIRKEQSEKIAEDGIKSITNQVDKLKKADEESINEFYSNKKKVLKEKTDLLLQDERLSTEDRSKIEKNFSDQSISIDAERIQKQYENNKASADAKVVLAEEGSQAYFEALRAIEEVEYEKEKELNVGNNGALELIDANHKSFLLDSAKKEADAQKQIADDKRAALIAVAGSAAAGLDNLAQLASDNGKKQNAASKALALASIAINTAIAIAETVKTATKAAGSVPPLAAPAVYAAYFAIGLGQVLAGVGQAKKILGASGGADASAGGATPAVSPSITNTNNTPTTQIDPGQAVYKTYVVASDMTEQQRKDNKIEDLSKV